MPEYVHEKRRLHAARLSAREFAAIEDALGRLYAAPTGSTTWEFTRKKDRSNSGDDLRQVLTELVDKNDITGFQISAESNETSDVIVVTGSDLGCFVEYTASQARLDSTLKTLRLIEAIFKDRRRKRTHLPIQLAFRPFLEIGARKQGLRMPWRVIVQDVITRLLSYAATATMAFIGGLLWARFS